MNKAVIELQNIKRNFQVGDETVHALRGVSFTIREGEFVTIMGTSGSGKSTLLNTLGCLDTPTSGEYLLDGISVRTMSKPQRAVLRNRKIGFVFQSYNLLPKTTAVENVELPLMYNSSVSASERRRRAIEALQAVGLGDRLEHKSNQMSGGQMQRVAIARALVNNPAVILADEATGNLDTRTSFEILVLFQKLHAEGRTIIFVTHNHTKSERKQWPALVLIMGSISILWGLLVLANSNPALSSTGYIMIGLGLVCYSISSKVILLAAIWRNTFKLANRIPQIPVFTALACLFLSAFLFEMASLHNAYFVPARVLAGLGGICFTLFSIVSILESGTSK